MSGIKKLYLVDDDADDRFLVSCALREVVPDIFIVEALDGAECMGLFEDNVQMLPALVLLDVNMPRMTGLETLETLRSMPLAAEVPIVIYSTSSDPLLIESANKLGVTEFVKKPDSFEGYLAFARKLATYL